MQTHKLINLSPQHILRHTHTQLLEYQLSSLTHTHTHTYSKYSTLHKHTLTHTATNKHTQDTDYRHSHTHTHTHAPHVHTQTHLCSGYQRQAYPSFQLCCPGNPVSIPGTASPQHSEQSSGFHWLMQSQAFSLTAHTHTHTHTQSEIHTRT